ncbi:MAG: hypothetical protein KH324_09310 [Ruminococcus sp.]|jgi:hypothetical protein|nr:hypothetical protein [Ruminococcus sp.]
MSDWRLNGQERYLYGVKLKHMNIKDKLNPSDHEHCEFCLEKISNYPNTIHDAYCTEDEYHWVCDNCYNDFKARFNWK